jgi:chromosome segregation ATPase
MSKADKPVKPSATSQLKKDLIQAGKVIQSLTNSLEKLEIGFSDAETALINERSLKEELSSAQRDLTNLRKEQKEVQNEHRVEIANFADATLKLMREYEGRSARLGLEYESKLKDFQKDKEGMESKLKQQVNLEKAETRRLKEIESRGRYEIQSQLQKEKENWQKKEEQFNTSLQQCDRRIAELLEKNKALNKELSDHETMLKGSDTEKQRLGSRLAALEAFPPQDVTEK